MSKRQRLDQTNDGRTATTNNGALPDNRAFQQTSPLDQPPSPFVHQRNRNNANIASNFFFQSPQRSNTNNNCNHNNNTRADLAAGRSSKSATNNFHSAVPLQEIASLYGENASIQVSMRGSNPSFFFVQPPPETSHQANIHTPGIRQHNPSMAEHQSQQHNSLNSPVSDLASFQSLTANLPTGLLSSLNSSNNHISKVSERIKLENFLAMKEYLAKIANANVREGTMARLLMAQMLNNDLPLLHGTVAGTPGGAWGNSCGNDQVGSQMQQKQQKQQQTQQQSQPHTRHALMKRISDQLDEKITQGVPLTPLDHLTMTHINQYLDQQENLFLQQMQERKNASSNVNHSQLLSVRLKELWESRIRQIGMDDGYAVMLSPLERAQSILGLGESRVQRSVKHSEDLSPEQLDVCNDEIDSEHRNRESEYLKSGHTVTGRNEGGKTAAALQFSPLRIQKERRDATKRTETANDWAGSEQKTSHKQMKMKMKINTKTGNSVCLPFVDKSGDEEFNSSRDEEKRNRSINVQLPLVGIPGGSEESGGGNDVNLDILNHITRPTDASKNSNDDEALIAPHPAHTKTFFSQSILHQVSSKLNDCSEQKPIIKAPAKNSLGVANKSECGEVIEQLISSQNDRVNQEVTKAMNADIDADGSKPEHERMARFSQSDLIDSSDASELIRTQLQEYGLTVQKGMLIVAGKELKSDLETDLKHQVQFSSSKFDLPRGLLQLNDSTQLKPGSMSQSTKSIGALREYKSDSPGQDSPSHNYCAGSKHIALKMHKSDEVMRTTKHEDKLERDALKMPPRSERNSSYGSSSRDDTSCQREPSNISDEINAAVKSPPLQESLKSESSPSALIDVITSINDENLRAAIEEDKQNLELKLVDIRAFYDEQIANMDSRLEVYNKLEGFAEQIAAIRSSNQPKRKKSGAKTPVHDMAMDMLHLAWQNYRMLESTVDRLLDWDKSDKSS
ncbi:hypothetical protein ACHAXS_012010 [Conticribra weissflogii]